MRSETSQNSVHLTWRSFEAILDASSHSLELWNSFASHLESECLLRELLLDDSRPAIRKSVVKHVTQKCGSNPRYDPYSNNCLRLISNLSSPAQMPTINFAVTFWRMVGDLIPVATTRAEHCEETFTLAHTLFNKLAGSSTTLDVLNLNDLVTKWGSLLLRHQCVEVCRHGPCVLSNANYIMQMVGHPESVDMVAHGLANLLLSAAQRAKSSRQTLTCG